MNERDAEVERIFHAALDMPETKIAGMSEQTAVPCTA